MKNIKQNQKGLVSIIVTMVMMVVITLIVIGFSRLTNREQRQSLDSQLNTQAFYAAETGVNDAIKKLSDYPGLSTTEYIDDCSAFINTTASGSVVLDNTLDNKTIEYSCLLVDPSPTSLKYNAITDRSTVVTVSTKDATPFTSLTFEWDNQPNNAAKNLTCPAVGEFQPTWPANCDAGVLRIDVIPTNSAMTRDSLKNSQYTTFLVPTAPGSPGLVSYNPSTSTSGQVVAGSCSNNPASGYACSVTINNLTQSSYALRLRSPYKNNRLRITAAGSKEIAGAQAVIDATGKATDVLRRISVNVDIGRDRDGIPDFAIQSREDICKRFGVIPGLAPTQDGTCSNF